MGLNQRRKVEELQTILPGRVKEIDEICGKNYYGFIGVALAWQVLFLIIAREPVRSRLAMLAGTLEKLAFGAATVVLHLQGRIPATVAGFGLIDVLLGLLFLEAFRRTAHLDATYPERTGAS